MISTHDGKKVATIDNRFDMLAENNEKNRFVNWNNRRGISSKEFFFLWHYNVRSIHGVLRNNTIHHIVSHNPTLSSK